VFEVGEYNSEILSLENENQEMVEHIKNLEDML
jgi:hypothetical protein